MKGVFAAAFPASCIIGPDYKENCQADIISKRDPAELLVINVLCY